MRKIIMVNGKKRSGKDIFSDVMQRKSFIKYSIADSLKDIASSILEIDKKTLETLKNNADTLSINFDKFNTNFRKAIDKIKLNYSELNYTELEELNLQISNFDITKINIFENYVDSDVDSDVDSIVDIRKFLQKLNIFKIIFNDNNIWINILIKKLEKISDNIVISDLRFPNEAERIFDVFKKDIVKTVKIIGKNLYDFDEYDNHSSETSLNDWEFDYHVNNTIWDEILLDHQGQLIIQDMKW